MGYGTRRIPLIGLTTLLLALPLAGMAWTAMNRSEVIPTANDSFEVINRASSAARDYWCAAGDFAIVQLRTSATQRVYVKTAISPSKTVKGRKAVEFSLSPPPGGPPPQTYSLTVKTVGDNLTAAAARQYCYGNRFLDF